MKSEASKILNLDFIRKKIQDAAINETLLCVICIVALTQPVNSTFLYAFQSTEYFCKDSP